ncbi:MAG: hypothetical protein HON42_02840 [Alphaproteobacteria bacterium]|jgi:hypothetical protein|nr:hypothetical protein [Alphaproteobacteria bacterium]MBT5828433.1 hypothetical protein [Alphaproteobacteria bacterium]
MIKIILLNFLFIFQSYALDENLEQMLKEQTEEVELNRLTETSSDNIAVAPDVKSEDLVKEVTEKTKKKLELENEKEKRLNKLEEEKLTKERLKLEENNEILKVLRKSSLFHTQEQLDRLDNALEAINDGRKIIIEDIDGEENVEVIRSSAINFYLNSIIFYSKTDWILWLNGNKITPKTNESDLELIEINNNFVRLRWITGYEKFVNAIIKETEASRLPARTYVEVSDNIAKIDFTLEPNQTFSVGSNIKILEGRNNE